MSETYKQCNFQHVASTTVVWIPSWAAVVGNKIQLLEAGSHFWEVTSVGQMELPKEQARVQERGYKSFQGSTRGGGIDE